MKIDRLYTLSQFVSAMDDYTKESHSYERACKKIIKYNDFLKKPLNNDMFVNHLEKPKICMFHNTNGTNDIDSFDSAFELWQEAEKKVIFKGFESVVNHDWLIEKDDIQILFNKSSIYYSELQSLGEFRCEIQTLHDLAEATKGELEINLEV